MRWIAPAARKNHREAGGHGPAPHGWGGCFGGSGRA